MSNIAPRQKPLSLPGRVEERVKAITAPTVDRGSYLVKGRCAQCGSGLIQAERIPLVNTVELTCLCCGSERVVLPRA